MIVLTYDRPRGLRALLRGLLAQHLWLCRVRYPLATLARLDTIVFIDDDVVIKDGGFLRYMHDAFASVRPIDVLSCWTALWTDWNDERLEKVRMNFHAPRRRR